jgi:16S rRNA (adenine(1408)-N(1))-methyltransferase
VSTSARANPNKFFIGIDANVEPLKKPSMRATRKPAKGGLPNALFVQASVEDLPSELAGIADEIHVHFPWGSLLRAVATGDMSILSSLRRLAADDCILEIVFGIDPVRDRSDIERLALPKLSQEHVSKMLIPRYADAGYRSLECRELQYAEWRSIETTWARKLRGDCGRRVTFLLFQAT